MGARVTCAWCGREIPAGHRRDSKFCSTRHRQASWRFAVGRAPGIASGRPMTFCYADPPYPGKAHLYPEQQEVDHQELVTRLVELYPDGWALSTSAEGLQRVLALCPPDVRVAAWVRQARHVRSMRAVNAWEPVIIRGGRPSDASVAQVLEDVLIYKGRYRAFPGALIGMKPPEFSEWVFRQLGAARGDTLVDLYPGSGAVTLAWERFTSLEASGRVALGRASEASLSAGTDASGPGASDASDQGSTTRRADPAERLSA